MIYRARDLLLPPALISFSRLVLAACFPASVDRPWAALAVLAAAAISDVLDGWVARRYGLATATGAVLDPITDKLFVLTVALTLVVRGHLETGTVLLLSVREIGELPLVAWFALSPSARAARVDHPKANVPGKLATAMQFVTVGWILLRVPGADLWIGATAVAGLLAAVSYWRRALASRPAK
jgi:CDP-diacylglycerol--glycerol-3-phosphate 3-phosphatidyltransferase/cardiolipin synthase